MSAGRCGSPLAAAAPWFTAALACWVVVWCVFWATSEAVAASGSAAAARRRGGESQIDESAPDESAPAKGRPGGRAALSDRVRDYVEGSLVRYDSLKSESTGFRRIGWFPSFFLRDPERDVVLEPGSAGKKSVTAHIAYARRDLEQRLVIAPADRFELPGADKRFFAELIGALATLAPELEHARLNFWFATLRPDGQMTWELRGGIGLSATAARGIPAGGRTAEVIWPLLDSNSLPPSVWDGP